MKNIESLQMLPRFNSEKIDHKKIRLLPRFQSDYQRKYYDENQSADTAMKTISGITDMKFLERAYGQKCWPMVNTKIGKFDLQYTYEVVGNTLESYIHYRKLDRCKALSNFIEYRNKVYKREKIAQYASSEPKIQTKEIHSKPTKIIQIEEQQTPSLPTSPSSISQTAPSTPISSSQSMISEKSQKLPTPIPSLQSMSPKTSPPTPIPSSRSNTSQKLSPSSTKEAIIPIPSPDLLKRPISKQSKINTPKKTTSNIKQTSSSRVKGQS